jgi:hypothetical protein
MVSLTVRYISLLEPGSEIDDVPRSFRTVLAVFLGVTIAARWKNGQAWAAMLSYVPSIIGTILVATLPGTNKFALLFSYWISSTLSLCRSTN